jgi:hypothetical protein
LEINVRRHSGGVQVSETKPHQTVDEANFGGNPEIPENHRKRDDEERDKRGNSYNTHGHDNDPHNNMMHIKLPSFSMALTVRTSLLPTHVAGAFARSWK